MLRRAREPEEAGHSLRSRTCGQSTHESVPLVKPAAFLRTWHCDVLSSHRVLRVVRSLKGSDPVDFTMPNKAHTRAVMVGPGEGSGLRSTCGREPYSRMGAYTSNARSDTPIHALPDGAGQLRPAVFNVAAGGAWFSPGAFQHDLMMTLCDPLKGARSEPNGTSRSFWRSE
jgi:hypothetical protein